MTITDVFWGRLGNTCLQAYKLFLFAKLNRIPFESIKLPQSKYNPIFENFKENFVSDNELSKVNYTIQLENFIDLQNVKFSDSDNIRFKKWNWLYPNTIEELRMFNALFDAKTLHKEVLNDYGCLFNKPTVGMTVRRGDFVGVRKVLDESQLKDLVSKIQSDRLGFVKVLLSSDDIQWCKTVLNGVSGVEFIVDKPERQIMVLSFCDFVINNGAYYRSIDQLNNGQYESTFGQIAQCLCVSRHFVQQSY